MRHLWSLFIKTLGILILICCILTIAFFLPFYTYPVKKITIDRIPAQTITPNLPFMAGVAIRDITPPIGIPKAGYSLWSKSANGFRTRLKVRAFYLKSSNDQSIAIVQSDLHSGSSILNHKIATLVAAETDIDAHQLTLVHTHTHNGPGQFFDNNFYNTFTSNRPGFDTDLFNFLSHQMAAAIIEAYQQQRPAKIAIGQKKIYQLNRNRSLGAYIKNQNVTNKSLSPIHALNATDPTMTMIRIDVTDTYGNYHPKGVLTTFSLHGTTIPAAEHSYHGDIWSILSRQLEIDINRLFQPPWPIIHAPFTTAIGDIAPNYINELRGAKEARRIGVTIAKEALRLFHSLTPQQSEQLELKLASREVNLLDSLPKENKPLCNRALVGTALLAGANGDEVFPISYIFPFKEGYPKTFFRDSCHQQKRHAFSFLQHWLIAKSHFPHHLILQTIQLNDLLLVPLPFEVTVSASQHIRKKITNIYSQINRKPPKIVVSSVSNGYFGYATTPEEYTVQWYEGGHTIYGPGTTPYLASQSAALTKKMLQATEVDEFSQRWHYNLFIEHHYPPLQIAKGNRKQITKPTFVAATATEDPYWYIQYLDVPPHQIQLHHPLIHIESQASSQHPWKTLTQHGINVNDQGFNIQFVHLKKNVENDMDKYEIRWFNPPLTQTKTRYRFYVEPREDQPPFYSAAFH